MSRRPNRPNEVFLSHASQDRRFASRVADALRAEDISVWYSRTHLRGAQQWHDEIGKALARCDWFLLVVSPNALASRWVKQELLYALRSPRYDERIVPLIYRRCNDEDLEQLSWTLRSYQHIDFTRAFDAGHRSLLRVWGMETKKR